MKNEVTGYERFDRVHIITNILFSLLFLFLALICVLPVLFVLSISLSAEDSIIEFGYRFIPPIFSTEGFAYLIQQREVILRSVGISIFVTVFGTVLGVLLTTLMGYVISRPDYKLRNFLTWLVFVPMVFNGGLIATYYINSNFLRLSNTVWALILPLCVSSFNIVICKTFFRLTIPDSLVESAKIDGATQLTIFFKLVLPLSLPVLATIALFLTFGYWNDWWQAMLYIDNRNLYTLQALLNGIMADINMLAQNSHLLGMTQAELIASMPKEAARMAIAVVIVLPIACAYPFFQRYFISGLTIGAVKG
jgi:putative aldouronate transport system permease protein